MDESRKIELGYLDSGKLFPYELIDWFREQYESFFFPREGGIICVYNGIVVWKALELDLDTRRKITQNVIKMWG